MTQFIHKCNRVFSRIFYDGERISKFERLARSRTRSDWKVTPEGELVKEIPITKGE